MLFASVCLSIFKSVEQNSMIARPLTFRSSRLIDRASFPLSDPFFLIRSIRLRSAANVDADEHIIPPGQLDQWQKCRTIQSVPIVTPRRRSTALRPVRPTPLMEANILDGAGACLGRVLKWTHSQEAASPRGLLSRKAQWRFIDGSGPLTVSASFSIGLPCIMIVPWSFVKAGMDPKGTVSIGLR